MKHVLTLLASTAARESDAAVAKVAEFLGLTCKTVDASAGVDPLGANAVLAASAAALRERGNGSFPPSEDVLRHLAGGTLVLHGFSAAAEDAAFLQDLTNGGVAGVTLLPAGAHVHAYSAALAADGVPLAGLTQTIEQERAVPVFELGKGPSVSPLITVGEKAILGRMRVGATDVFLLADAAIADLDQPCLSHQAFRTAHARLLPIALSLRLVFGSACWTDPAPAANLVIDDPMLRPRYGFVDYDRLMAEARSNNYAVTIAFIPFNHRRSNRRTVAFLREHADRFSIAVHGCDHTGGEFGAENGERLQHLSHLAMSRMHDHERRAAMPFDRVMVFPQGVFSAPAFAALKRSGYEAVVNTEFMPARNADPDRVRLRDLLEGAIMSYAGFPLFRRHYPKDVFDFAVDLFWGRPVLLVEHHGYFRDGYAHLAGFVRQLSRLHRALSWKPLGQVVLEHAVIRPLPDGRVAVKFFTPTLRFRNPTAAPRTFVFEKRETEPELIEGVTVNGGPATFTVEGGVLRSELALPASGETLIKIVYRAARPAGYRLPWKDRSSATARRYLSDFRDNYIARSPRLLALATKLKGWVRR